MGFLCLSVQYPSDQIRSKYLQSIHPNFRSSTFDIYQPLPASAVDEDWKLVVTTTIRKYCSETILDQPQVRPLKPNDDNYLAFVGPQWQRFSNPATRTVVPPLSMAAWLHAAQSSHDPTPHYDCCAYCTKGNNSTMTTTVNTTINHQQCSKCKIVKYCSRECQSKHWKACHQQSCIRAVSNQTLWMALQTNDGFLLTSDECRELARGLETSLEITITASPSSPPQPASLIHGFATYFKFVADLGGCFIL